MNSGPTYGRQTHQGTVNTITLTILPTIKKVPRSVLSSVVTSTSVGRNNSLVLIDSVEVDVVIDILPNTKTVIELSHKFPSHIDVDGKSTGHETESADVSRV